MGEIGHEETLGKSLHSRRSIQGALQTGRSIRAIDFPCLNFGYAAVGVVGDAKGIVIERSMLDWTRRSSG